MLIAEVLCGLAAAVCAALGLWSLTRPAEDVVAQPARWVAPTQLAAAVMLAAGAAVALAAPRPIALVLVSVSVAGAIGTIAAGSWQSARCALRREAIGCSGHCASCTLADCAAASITADVDRMGGQ